MFRFAVFYELFLKICLSELSVGLSNQLTPLSATEKRRRWPMIKLKVEVKKSICFCIFL